MLDVFLAALIAIGGSDDPTPPALVETGIDYRVSISILLAALILLISGAVAIVVREVRGKR